MEWQPIETAPKDGAPVLLWGLLAGEVSGPAETPGVHVGYYENGSGTDYPGFDWYGSDGDMYATWVKPTHWMPLPPPPRQRDTGQ